MNKPYFLAKAGQIYGPFDRAEIETLRESGDYEKYTWFWDETVARWQPVDPPPAPPRASTGTSARPDSHPSNSTPEIQQAHASPANQWSISEEKLRSISVLCHDQQSVASGALANVTDAGCELIVQSRSTSPDFQAKLPILLHLLDLPTGRSMNVSGRIGRIDRRDGAWVYRIHWKHCPQILNEQLASNTSDTAAGTASPEAKA